VWSVIPSLDLILQGLAVAFTQPSCMSFQRIFTSWVMCLGRRTEFRVFEAFEGKAVSRKERHPFDRYYNFFSRSAWTVHNLARQVAIQIVVALNRVGELHLVVDGTLLHKSGKCVYAIGWFYDAVRSTKKRAATSLGNQWVVLGLAIRIPGTQRVFCLPIHAMLQYPGKKQPGPGVLARQMLAEALTWFPDRKFVLIGDGGFSVKNLLLDLDERVTYVGLMRGDAAIHDSCSPVRRKGKRGATPKYGPRLPSPREIVKKADRAKGPKAVWRWKTIKATAYGTTRKFQVCAFQAVWPKVFGSRPILVVISRGLDVGYGDVYLYTTRLDADPAWVVETYACRTSLEATFKDSKQVMEIQKPQHWCRASIDKLAPCVWLMQSLIMLWYITEGQKLPEARAARKRLGPWETEWSLRHMLRLLRRETLRAAINTISPSKHEMQQLIASLENYLNIAA
jgi:hypothetical protein